MTQMNRNNYSQRHAHTAAAPDPFGGDFSQQRVVQAYRGWPVIQWHGGLASLVGDSDSMKIMGGFFMEDDRITDLGLDPNLPAPGFEKVALRLGGNQIHGWGASQLHIAFLFTNFCWEDRETGRNRNRFAPEEYERRKKLMQGTERELRGRTRALVGIRELMDQGVADPVLLSMRGTYSASVNAILRDLRRMTDEATRLRRRAGHEGAIPREAFWVPIFAGSMEDVGEGTATSRVSRPTSSIPAVITREFLVQSLVEAEHRRADGTFDLWAEQYAELWEEKTTIREPEPEVQPNQTPNQTPYQNGYSNSNQPQQEQGYYDYS